MLWNIIRDWFVMYIWGGMTSMEEYYGGFIGYLYQGTGNNGNEGIINTNTQLIKIGSGQLPDIWDSSVDLSSTSPWLLSLGDWLSTTATIIVLCALCFFFFLMVRWLFRLTAGLIQGRG